MCKVLHSSEEWWKDKMEEELMKKNSRKMKTKSVYFDYQPETG